MIWALGQGDQASIIGGAINFVKELEQRLQSLGGKKETESESEERKPFSEFFSFPQYSTTGEVTSSSAEGCIADIEVTMVESHANLKIRAKKRPKQLLKMVSALYTMRLTILHLNVTTTADIVLYCISVKVCLCAHILNQQAYDRVGLFLFIYLLLMING